MPDRLGHQHHPARAILTMGNGSKLRLLNGNGNRLIDMQIRLDAGEGGYAVIDGSQQWK